MPFETAKRDPFAYRFYDYPMTGSIYRMLDDKRLVRGPTYVKLPSGTDIRVPAQLKHEVTVPAAVHENRRSQNKLEELMKLLNGARREKQTPGFQTGGRFDRPAQSPLLHPRELPRRATMGDHTVHF